MMARCGRPELDSCPRGVGRGAPGRKRRRLVLAPPKSARNPPDQTPEEGCRFKVAGSRRTARTAPASPRPATRTANSRYCRRANNPTLNEHGYCKSSSLCRRL